LDQLVAPMRRMRVEQAHPKIARNLLDFAEQTRQRRAARGIHLLARAGLFRPEIHSVIGRILTYKTYLLHTLGDKAAHLCDDGLGRAAAVASAHFRDDAKAARMIASFGDFQVSAVRRGEAKTRRVPIGNVVWMVSDEVRAAL